LETFMNSVRQLGGISLYLTVVSGCTLFILIYGVRRLRSLQKRRVDFTRNMDVTEAIETDALDEDAEKITRSQATSGIKARFELIEKIYVPAILLVGLFLACIPFIPEIHATYISLVAGVLAVLVGIAGKPIVENMISGVAISISRPLRINDFVIIDDKYGTVENITLLYTVIKVWNWRRYVIPNHKLLQKEFINLSLQEEQEWAYVEFYVAPGEDIDLVKKLAKQAMQVKYLDSIEDPSFWVINMEKDAILCWVAGWAKDPAQAWALRSATRKNLSISFRENGISHQLSNLNIEKPPTPHNVHPS